MAETQVCLEYDWKRLEELCRKWSIERFSLFGSVLRPDFRPDSDVDVLIDFSPEAVWSLGKIVDLQMELGGLFGRSVDVAERSALRNPYRSREILASQRVVYEASKR
ncbi:MAG: nucleotidyltransferase domain-containing protein [Candidatus Ozemobacteraceae bacterium]